MQLYLFNEGFQLCNYFRQTGGKQALNFGIVLAKLLQAAG
jgi:hypothetical protein